MARHKDFTDDMNWGSWKAVGNITIENGEQPELFFYSGFPKATLYNSWIIIAIAVFY